MCCLPLARRTRRILVSTYSEGLTNQKKRHVRPPGMREWNTSVTESSQLRDVEQSESKRPYMPSIVLAQVESMHISEPKQVEDVQNRDRFRGCTHATHSKCETQDVSCSEGGVGDESDCPST
jgi:hypothetical protein